MMKVSLDDSRYDRQELITWWSQTRLQSARVLVVGAGALGNELLKNLALLGVGHIEVIDLDVIERSNLARCVLFRESDNGRPKAETAAAAAGDLNPDVHVVGHIGDVARRGVAWIGTFDVVLGGLDNRAARVWVNQAARKMGRPWIDGAIEGLRGVVRVFQPIGPCYECTLGEVDREILSRRRSCALLSEEEMLTGKVPTTVTSASFIAAVQVQEAVKLLHDPELLALHNQGWIVTGETLDSYRVEYSEDPFCLAHDTYCDLKPVVVDGSMTLRSLTVLAQRDLDDIVSVDLEDSLVRSATCTGCGAVTDVQRRLVDLGRSDARCKTCDALLQHELATSLHPDDPLLDVPVALLGLPEYDVVTVRGTAARVHYVLSAP